MDRIEYDNNGNARAFVGAGAVEVYRAAVIASGLRLYAKTGIRPSRAYTPTAMMRAAKEITGKTFKARDYMGAADALSAWVEEQKARIAAQGLPEGVSI